MALPPGAVIRTVDYHSGGQSLRIVTEGGPLLSGTTSAARRESALANPQLDAFRRFLCWEPRGHADMYAAYLSEPDDPECDFAVVFCHNTGYPPSCGHGALALAAFAIESGLVEPSAEGETTVTIEIPAGRSVVHVRSQGGEVQGLRVHRAPAYAITLDLILETSLGDIRCDIAFSGATFASVNVQNVAHVGGSGALAVDAEHSESLVAIAREVLSSLQDHEFPNDQGLAPLQEQPGAVVDERLNGVFGVILWENRERENGRFRQRAVNIFNDGWIERSPGAAMAGARLAVLGARGELAHGEPMIQESISGARVTAWIDREGGVAVETSAHRTAENVFFADGADSVEFSLR